MCVCACELVYVCFCELNESIRELFVSPPPFPPPSLLSLSLSLSPFSLNRLSETHVSMSKYDVQVLNMIMIMDQNMNTVSLIDDMIPDESSDNRHPINDT
jgi:hypothetical protein